MLITGRAVQGRLSGLAPGAHVGARRGSAADTADTGTGCDVVEVRDFAQSDGDVVTQLHVGLPVGHQAVPTG